MDNSRVRPHVRFAAESRHKSDIARLLICAKLRRTALQQSMPGLGQVLAIFASSWRGLKGFGT
jgi:hypothetical protein